MSGIIDFLKTMLAKPDELMQFIKDHGGIYVVMFIVFAETGLFAGFFLPGDSLLFITGIMISSTGGSFFELIYAFGMISLAAIFGNFVGYWFGRKSGHLWFEKKETFFFKQKHLKQAHDFYEEKGGLAIIMGRFLPIVRTFAPLVAGIVKMDRKKFLSYSIIGALAWVVSMILAGYFLGSYEIVKKNIDKITIGIILVTTGPVLIKMIFGKKKEAQS